MGDGVLPAGGLGDERFAALRAGGAAMSVDEAVEYAIGDTADSEEEAW